MGHVWQCISVSMAICSKLLTAMNPSLVLIWMNNAG